MEPGPGQDPIEGPVGVKKHRRKRKRALGGCPDWKKQSPFLPPSRLDSHTVLPSRPFVTLRPEFTLDPTPQALAPQALIRRLQGEMDLGVAGLVWGRSPKLLPGGSTTDRVFSVSISSCPVTATPFSPRARGCPGPQKPESPVCWPWCLWGQLKDPWCGHSTRLLIEEPWLVLGEVFLPSPFFAPPCSLHRICRARGFGVFGFLSNRCTSVKACQVVGLVGTSIRRA